MPNHVAHRVHITGPQDRIDAFKALMFTSKPEVYGAFHKKAGEPTGEIVHEFEFEAIIPMPKILLEVTKGSELTLGLFALGVRDQAHFAGMFGTPLEYEWVKALGITTREELLAHLEKFRPEAVKQGRLAIRAQQETGFQDWYEWAIANWGTKWGAYSFAIVQDEPGHLEFTFDTAWSHPQPVFEKLGELFPDLAIEVQCFDEGWGFAGTGYYGDVSNGLTFEFIDANPQTYEEVYGEPYNRHEEEEV